MERKELHIAPMINYSHRDFRALLRILTSNAILWTEMIVDNTILNAREPETHLGFEPSQHPIVCQMGGNDPLLAKRAAHAVARYGYDEIDVNCGCPSDKVANEREFGASLMKNPKLVREMIEGMPGDLAVSVKTRIGIEGREEDLIVAFLEELRPACKKFVLHARKVYLDGLNARKNRSIPPLDYDRVYDLCRRFPDCEFCINGGIKNLRDARRLCFGPDVPFNLTGCMLGRLALDSPSSFWDVDRYFYRQETNPCRNRRDVLVKYVQYLERTYPRRCCDDDHRVTYLYPPPPVLVPPNTYCPKCKDLYLQPDFPDGFKSSPAPRGDQPEYPSGEERFRRRNPGVKVSRRVIGRALKPVQTLFAGTPCSKSFRCALQNPPNTNCGPGFILRSAVRSTPDQYLDEPFVKTEDLKLPSS